MVIVSAGYICLTKAMNQISVLSRSFLERQKTLLAISAGAWKTHRHSSSMLIIVIPCYPHIQNGK